jgi:hypothetical protein
MLGKFALGEQSVGGDGFGGDVEGFEHRDGHANLVGAF